MTRFFLCFCLSIGTAISVIAKSTPSPDALFAKLDKAYQSGDYKGGRKLLLQSRGTLTQLGGTDGYANARAYCHEARFLAALDKFHDYQTNINEATRILNRAPKEDFDNYSKAMIDLCEAYLAFDEGANAEKTLQQLKSVLQKNAIGDEFLKIKTDYIQVKILLLQGYINQAQKLTETCVLNYQSALSKPIKASKEELFMRKNLYGELLLFNGIAAYENGDPILAESYFNHAASWVKKNNPGDGTTAMASYYVGLIKLDEDDLTEANRRFHEADALAQKAYKAGAENYIRIKEVLIPTLKKLEKHKEAQIQNNAMDAAINDYYGKNGYHFYRNKISDIRRDIINESYSRAQKNLTQLAYQNVEIPKNHSFRSELCLTLYYLHLKLNQYDQALSNLQEFIRIKKEKFGDKAPAYHEALLKLAEYDYLYLDNFKEAEDIFTNSLENVIRKEKSRKSKSFFPLLFMEITLFEITDRYDRAYKLMKEALSEAEKLFSTNGITYAACERRFAQLDIKAGNYAEAEKKIQHAESILAESKSSRSVQPYIELYETKTELLLLFGQYEQAEKSLKKSLIKYQRNNPNSELITTSTMELKAQIGIYLGRYSQVESELTDLVSGREKKLSSKSRSLIKPLQLLAMLKKTTGEFIEAEKNIEKASKISKEVFGDASVNYAENLLVLAELNASVGDYEKAESNAQIAYSILKNTLGANHIKSSIAMNQLALMKLYHEKKYAEIKPLFTESLNNAKRILGADNPIVASLLENFGLLSLEMRDFVKADESVNNAITIWESRLGSSNIQLARLYRFKGTIYFKQRKMAQAKEFYLKSQNLFAELFDKNHEEYIQSLGLSARAYYANGEYKNAVAASEETIEKTLVYLHSVFPALSERGKALFWEKVKDDFEFYKTLTFAPENPSGDMVEKVFNISLQTKAILLNSSIKIRQKILSSGDTTLIGLYNTWTKKREELTSTLGQTAAQRKENNSDVSKLENDIEGLEKKLSQYSLFSTGKENPATWSTIKENMREKEVLLEFTRFRKFSFDFSDTIWYAVMAVAKDTKGNPDYVLIKNGKEMEGKFLKYYRNCIKGEIEDEYSYEKYWKPLVPLLKKSPELIYLSQDGVYHQINLETIKLPEGDYVLNKYNLAFICTANDLLKTRKTSKAAKFGKGDFKLFGNPAFYSSPDSKKQLSDLPGAEEEVFQINQLVKSQRLSSQLFLQADASEENIKKLNNPAVFHIATHGFFMQNKADDDENTDPLLRSGLVLRYGGELIASAKGYELNRTEGVLTAKEAMNLNLDSTQLVVLSACETGIGEISTGEGVFGLQRSFQVAGAQNVIMSLFKVNDEATKELMLEFYKRWMESGDKRNAFAEAKKMILLKYKTPKYWGSFLIIGL